MCSARHAPDQCHYSNVNPNPNPNPKLPKSRFCPSIYAKNPQIHPKLIAAYLVSATVDMFNSPGVLAGSLKHLKQRKVNLTRTVNLEWPGQAGEISRNLSNTHTQNPVLQPKKLRRFIDPQENAGRVSPDQDALPQDLNHDEPGEEEGFQQDHRVLQAPKRRRRTPTNKRAVTTAAVTKPKRRKRIIDDDNDNAEGAAALVAGGSTTSPTEKQSDSASRSIADSVADEEAEDNEDPPTPPPERVQLENYKMAKELAKINTAARAKKKTQTRKVWTDLETETLINLISDHGTSWKLLKDKDVGKVLLGRDQTALKDKARNIKFDYLK